LEVFNNLGASSQSTFSLFLYYNIISGRFQENPHKSHEDMGNNKCQRAKATKLWKREENMTVLLPPFIERELRYIASGTAERISDTNAVMDESDSLGSSEDTTLPVSTRSQRFTSIGNND
jgi:hypothetical protein